MHPKDPSVDPILSAVVKGLRALLRQLDPSRFRTPRSRLLVLTVRFALEQAMTVVEVAAKQSSGNDVAERYAVYVRVAEVCAEVVPAPEDQLLAAVHLLCGESERELRRSGMSVEPGLLARLREHVGEVSVTYTRRDHTAGAAGAGGAGSCRRTVQVLYGTPPDRVLAKQIEESVHWELMPEDVREAIIRTGRPSVNFVLFGGAS